jgi:hypothetical protein
LPASTVVATKGNGLTNGKTISNGSSISNGTSSTITNIDSVS